MSVFVLWSFYGGLLAGGCVFGVADHFVSDSLLVLTSQDASRKVCLISADLPRAMHVLFRAVLYS